MRKTPKSRKKLSPAKRLAQYRARSAHSGIGRVEVAARRADFDRVRRFAQLLREGSPIADNLRHQVDAAFDHPFKLATTGAEFFAMTRRILGGTVDWDLPPREYDVEDRPLFGHDE